VTEIWLETS